MRKGIQTFPLPGFPAQPFLAGFAKVILNNAAVAIGQVAQFEREDIIIPNQGGPKSCPKSKKKHSATMITAERLHRCVVDNAHWFAQRFLEVESDPASAKMFRLAYNFADAHRGRKPE